ncbi:hypothetical protein GWK47_033097 [Chionoecetes opilio]|uniref:Uncharacterized protein n=1 Tax=Chionoecetes opilio TaxID=41210 RepID=A0A8J5CPQ6_CHIOP|nr:hypothetical protein GWK47_033097 [Chionoecetes opilio]
MNSTFSLVCSALPSCRMREPGLALEGPSDCSSHADVRVPINTGNILQGLSREMNSEVSSSSTPQRTTAKDVSSGPSKDVPFGTYTTACRDGRTRGKMPATSTELHPELKLYLTSPRRAKQSARPKFWSDRDKNFPYAVSARIQIPDSDGVFGPLRTRCIPPECYRQS